MCCSWYGWWWNGEGGKISGNPVLWTSGYWRWYGLTGDSCTGPSGLRFTDSSKGLWSWNLSGGARNSDGTDAGLQLSTNAAGYRCCMTTSHHISIIHDDRDAQNVRYNQLYSSKNSIAITRKKKNTKLRKKQTSRQAKQNTLYLGSFITKQEMQQY